MEEVYCGIGVVILSSLLRMHNEIGILWYRCCHLKQIVEDALWKTDIKHWTLSVHYSLL